MRLGRGHLWLFHRSNEVGTRKSDVYIQELRRRCLGQSRAAIMLSGEALVCSQIRLLRLTACRSCLYRSAVLLYNNEFLAALLLPPSGPDGSRRTGKASVSYRRCALEQQSRGRRVIRPALVLRQRSISGIHALPTHPNQGVVPRRRFTVQMWMIMTQFHPISTSREIGHAITK